MGMGGTGVVDLRSDTFTVPGEGMRRAMAQAEVGDDVWGEDLTVRALEERVAELLGKEAAVYVPSGTMANLIAVAAQTRPGDEVIADADSHIAVYEVAGSAVVAGVQLRLLDPPDGVLTAAAVGGAVREPNIHHPVSRLLAVENTQNRRGGGALTATQVGAAAGVAHAAGLRVHCDGARLFNAAVALNTTVAELASPCDSVAVCLSKGLGAPVGSLLASDAATIDEARRWRKRLGGGMRQAGVIAAAGLYALDHNVERLAADHDNARLLAATLADAPGTTLVQPAVPTNIVLLRCTAPAAEVIRRAAGGGVLVTGMGPHLVRAMTYLDVDRAAIERAAGVLRDVLEALAAEPLAV